MWFFCVFFCGNDLDEHKNRINVPICFSISAASSGVALGITPGSENDVRKSVARTKTKRSPPTTGMAGVIFSAKNGQL